MFSSSNSWQLLLKGKLVHYLIKFNTSVYLSAPITLHCPANKIIGKSIVYLFMASSTLIALLRYERETEREREGALSICTGARERDMHRQRKPFDGLRRNPVPGS